MTLLHTFLPPVPTPGWVTEKITFSQDSSLALLETDTYNPLILINLNTFSSSNVSSIPSAISGAFFLNSSHSLVVVFTVAEFFLVDLANGVEYQLPFISATSTAADQDNNLFICHNNVVYQIRVSCSPLPSDSSFFLPLKLNDKEQKALDIIDKTLIFATNATSYINKVASSSPVSIYFLSFLNYFTLCSIYVLLNFPIPESLYRYLSLVY